MQQPTICGHCIVKNEENFIWFAVSSVIEYIDKAVIWDTGSTDATVEIIEELKKIYPDKISFRQYGNVSSEGLSRARQEMLDETNADWLITLDGDEVWWDDSIRKLVDEIKRGKSEAVAVRTLNSVGDIFHFLPESVGQYQIAGQKGHLNLRALSTKIPGLHVGGIYPREAYLDKNNLPVQERKSVELLEVAYLHLTHLERSRAKKQTAGERKFRYEIGLPFAKDFYYPEVFFKKKPAIVPGPWRRLSGLPRVISALETPLKKIKRIL